MTARPAGPRVGLDVQLALGTSTGIGEYVLGLADALRANGTDVVALRATALDPWRFDRRVLWDQVALPFAAARARVDLVHCASGTMPLVASVPLVATVHDVAWLRVQAHARPYARAYFGDLARTQYARARAIFVDSAFSRDELLALVPLDAARVVVCYPGVAADVMSVARAPGDACVALVVGTVEARKNLELLVRVAAHVPHLRVVAVGPSTPYRDRVVALAAELGVADRLDLRGYVSRAALLQAYATATLAAMPSRYEGFGYGAAQALCAGVPLVAASASSLPEVVGDAAPLLGPDDVDGWVEAVRAIVADPVAAQRRADRARAAACARFGWTASAAIVAATYRHVLA